MRATGRRFGNPAAGQAEGPPTNPVEMGLPDNALRGVPRVGTAGSHPLRKNMGRGRVRYPMAQWRGAGVQSAWPARPQTIRCLFSAITRPTFR